MSIKLTTEQFIAKANLVHNNKYSYELVDYKNTATKVKITCKSHGVWEQRPNSHLSGQGCKSCNFESQGESQASTAKSEFSTKSNIIHNNKYDYSLIEYKNNRTKVKIICSEHGIFEQMPFSHLSGQGCPTCANQNKGGRMDSHIL